MIPMSAAMERFELSVWPANKAWAVRAGREEGSPVVTGKTPEEAVQAWVREDVIARIVACNPPSDLLHSEVAEFRATGIVPERWRAD